MEDYENVPIPPETSDYVMNTEENMDTVSPLDVAVENDSDASDTLWQQQLVDTEQEILQEKENGKRAIEDVQSDDEPCAKKRANEFEKLWNNVNDNPSDFQAWTILLQHVDQVSDLESGRDAYDSFFMRYPYCYGYWKKYADLEKRKGTQETTMKVFNRGLEAIGLSVDLWIHYLEYATSKFVEDEEFVRHQFERSIESCGLEFRSDKLWDLYISWESAGKRWKNVTELYERLLGAPVSKYMQHWQKFQEHVKRHLPSEIVVVDEFLSVRRTVLAELNRSDVESPDEAPPGVEAAPGDDQVGTNVDEETKLIREKIIEARQKIHDKTVVDVKARWNYEDAIKRPYFHVKPLEKSQLHAWRTYLEFEMKEGEEKRIKVLFERCLIACAFYEEFWMRYIRYLEEQMGSVDELRAVYVRACTIHLQEKLRPHLAWAAFEEENGNSKYALEILAGIQATAMDMSLEAYMMSVAVERRRGNLDAAQDIYVNCLQKLKEKENKNFYSSIAVKYARFLTYFKNDNDKALEVIKDAYENDTANFNLLIALADNAMSCRPPKLDEAAEAFKMGTENHYSPTVRLMFAHRFLHFVTECSSESTSMNEALRLLRKIQHELRQEQAEVDDGSNLNKMTDATSGYQKAKYTNNSATTANDKLAVVSVNGSSTLTTVGTTSASASATATATATNAQTSPGYQNYQTPGYGYNQYQQGYSGPQYQGWGYPNQQGGGYGYNQQGWGGYSNYYGQR